MIMVAAAVAIPTPASPKALIAIAVTREDVAMLNYIVSYQDRVEKESFFSEKPFDAGCGLVSLFHEVADMQTA